jgi:hypothetical protein
MAKRDAPSWTFYPFLLPRRDEALALVSTADAASVSPTWRL